MDASSKPTQQQSPETPVTLTIGAKSTGHASVDGGQGGHALAGDTGFAPQDETHTAGQGAGHNEDHTGDKGTSEPNDAAVDVFSDTEETDAVHSSGDEASSTGSYSCGEEYEIDPADFDDPPPTTERRADADPSTSSNRTHPPGAKSKARALRLKRLAKAARQGMGEGLTGCGAHCEAPQQSGQRRKKRRIVESDNEDMEHPPAADIQVAHPQPSAPTVGQEMPAMLSDCEEEEEEKEQKKGRGKGDPPADEEYMFYNAHNQKRDMRKMRAQDFDIPIKQQKAKVLVLARQMRGGQVKKWIAEFGEELEDADRLVLREAFTQFACVLKANLSAPGQAKQIAGAFAELASRIEAHYIEAPLKHVAAERHLDMMVTCRNAAAFKEEVARKAREKAEKEAADAAKAKKESDDQNEIEQMALQMMADMEAQSAAKMPRKAVTKAIKKQKK